MAGASERTKAERWEGLMGVRNVPSPSAAVHRTRQVSRLSSAGGRVFAAVVLLAVVGITFFFLYGVLSGAPGLKYSVPTHAAG